MDKKIPYGINSYETLIKNNYYYVDKTMYLEKLEDVGRILVYLRPGRFGKSLFLSMMEYYYDVNSSDLFDDLFKDTYVYDNPTPNKNNYYILKLDFSGISASNKTEEEIELIFKRNVEVGINEFNSKYNFLFDTSLCEDANDLLLKFLSYFKTLNLDKKLYIMIDEYDNFTNAILEGDAKKFKSVIGKDGFVKAFYAVIKSYCGSGVVDRVFITGVCPITLDAMTTGFNISTDISGDVRFNSMIGLTHEEVKKLIGEIDAKERNEIYKLMIENYDGYLFNEEADERVFNATLVMYFLNNYFSFNKVPKELMDSNIASNYGKIGDLVRLNNNEFYKEILDEILKEDKISGTLKNKFNLEEDFMRDDIISLLYYFGYLTIDKTDEFTGRPIFRIPNLVMKKTYNNYFIKLLRDIDINIDDNILLDAHKEIILEGKIDKLSNYISEILKKSDNRSFINFDEKYINLLYFTLLQNNINFNVYNEYPCMNGYIDLMIFRNSKLAKNDIMIELKYIKVSDYEKDNSLVSVKKKEAIEQINSYSLDERIDKTNLKKYVVIFVGCEVKELIEI